MEVDPLPNVLPGVQERPAPPEALEPLAPSSLCEKCQNIFTYFESVDQWPEALAGGDGSTIVEDKNIALPHWGYDEELRKAAHKGCVLCTQFLHGFRDSRSSHEIQKYNDKVESRLGKGVVRIWTPETGRQPPSVYWGLELYLLNDNLGSNEDIGVEENGGRYSCYEVDVVSSEEGSSLFKFANTRDLSGLPLCKAWLEECLQLHPNCGRPAHSILPTRLIALDGPHPKLCVSDQLDGFLRYATLSHCWGLVKFVTLKTSNLETFETGIPSKALSKTFADAICITKLLGLKYIWIDSLCILQDDRTDWERESALMTSVYGNSTVTIAATSAADGRGGCLFEKSQLVKRKINWSSGNTCASYESFPSKLMTPGKDMAPPLETRGWTVQEYFLPPRTIHFFENQIFWNCCDAAACETFSRGLPNTYPISFCGVKEQVSLTLWPAIVQRYSHRQLTNIDDRLVAIAGLAELVQTQTQDQYVAGMWRSGLEWQLGWSISSESPSSPIASYIGPSWSWVSSLGSVHYPSAYDPSTEKVQVQVFNLQIVYASSNVFGRLSAATIRLSCNVILKGTMHRSACPFGCDFESSGQSAGIFVSWDQTGTADRVLWSQSSVGRDVSNCEAADTDRPTLFLVPILCQKIDVAMTSRGLVLELTGNRDGQYRRLGFFQVFALTEDGVNFERITKSQQCWAAVGDCAEVIYDNGKVEFVIDLV